MTWQQVPWIGPHRQAMAEMEDAAEAERSGNPADVAPCLKRALVFATTAAEAVPHGVQPTQAVLHRSAASIALRLGDLVAATGLISQGLTGDPPDAIRRELRKMLRGIPRG